MTERRQTRLAPEDDWRDRANCKYENPNTFTGAGRTEKEKRHITLRAKSICRGCVVVDECFLDALETGDTYGIRGGTSERQRSKALKDDEARELISEMNGEPDRRKLNIIRVLVKEKPLPLQQPSIPIPRQAIEDSMHVLAANNRGGRS